MASQIEIDYALLAGHAYISRRDPANRIPSPSGWTRLPGSSGYRRFDSSGFEAIAYRKVNESVIAFTGTDEFVDWTGPNIVQTLGLKASRQLREAAQLFTEIQRDFGGPGINILTILGRRPPTRHLMFSLRTLSATSLSLLLLLAAGPGGAGTSFCTLQGDGVTLAKACTARTLAMVG